MRCFKCGKLKCKFKIVCYTKRWEYAACDDHREDLCDKSNDELGKNNGVLRSHISSSSTVEKEILKKKTKKRIVKADDELEIKARKFHESMQAFFEPLIRILAEQVDEYIGNKLDLPIKFKKEKQHE